MATLQFPSDHAVTGGIEIQNLVKEGKLSQEAALAYAEKCGLSKTKEVYNFSVYKWNKVRTVQRLILQFDFKSQTLSDIQQGRRAEKIEFQDLLSYQSEDGLRLVIQFSNYGEYELDANTLDEKNKMIRLLGSILHHYESYSGEKMESIMSKPDEDEGEDQGHLNSALDQSTSPPPVPLTVDETFLPPTVVPQTLKEGLVEKKGHSVAFLMWPERYLKVCEGELLYYKPEEKEQALNIIPLKAKVTRVEKTGNRGFVVSLSHSKKTFSFRVRGNDTGKSAEDERDEWCKAILKGCRTRRTSDARLRRGTVTAKQYMEEVKKQKQQKKHPDSTYEEDDDPFANLDLDINVDMNLPTSATLPKFPKKGVVRKRSQTVTSPTESPGSRKSLRRDKAATERRHSTFYAHPDTTDVTTPFLLPMKDVSELVVSNRSQEELLHLLSEKLEMLAKYVLPTTTGKSHVDIIVTRMGNIIAALRQHHVTKNEQKDGAVTDSLNVDQEPLSPSSIGSTPSLPSERLVDGSSDGCSITSTDGDASSGLPDRVKCISPPLLATQSKNHTEPSDTTDVDVKDCDANSKSETDVPDRECVHSSTLPTPKENGSLATMSPTEPIAPQTPALITSPHPPPSPSAPILPQSVPPPPPPPEIPGVSPLPLPPGVPPPPLPPGAPPPPGSGLFHLDLPTLPERRPTKKMKRFHWNKISPATVQTSVWMDVATRDNVFEDIDYSELEKLFSADTQEVKKLNVVKKETVKSLLDNTRSRNIEIFLPSFPLKVQSLTMELDEQLNVVDGSTKLNVEHIVALKRFQPTQEEREMYNKYTGDKNHLPLADTFLLKLIEVPMLAMRLDLLFTIREFPANMDQFQPTLDLAWNACKELDESQVFLEVLSYVLAIGNYLNAGTPKGNAYGFQLKYLPKLMEFRGQGRTSLLEFLVQQFHIKKPDLLDMPSTLEAVAKASEISITSILAEIEVMGNELDKIEQSGIQVAKHPKISQDVGQQLHVDVKRFESQYRVRLQELDAKGQEMSSTYSILLTKFGENPSMDSEDFFSTISQFLVQFKKVAQERLPRTPVPSPRTPKNLTPDAKQPPAKTHNMEKGNWLKKALTVDVIDGEVQVDGTWKKSTFEPQSPTFNVLSQKTGGLKRKTKKLQPKADYLEKQSSEGKWAKRYFDLEQSKLHYYTSKGQKYHQTINLRGVPVRLLDSDKRVIVIETDTRSYNLRAKTTALAEEWIKALQMHSQS